MENKKLVIGVIVGLFLFLLVIPGCVGVGAYNRLVTSSETIDSSWSQVENVLQRRYDLIPNLVNTVKGYAAHEKGLLEEIAKLRSQWAEAKGSGERIKASQGLEGALSRLMVVVENYPNLKANENFLKLQDELAGTENRIAVERMRYNDAVREYNVLTRRFPSNIIASIFNLGRKDVYFEANETAKTAPKVEF